MWVVLLLGSEPPPPSVPIPPPMVCPTQLPLIHFPIPATSRSLEGLRHVEDLPLLKYFLPSLIASAQPDRFRYDIGVGFDRDDPWFSNTGHTAAIQRWWSVHWGQQWSQYCAPSLWFMGFANTRSRPAWAVNYMAQHAYERGANYFFQWNDDSELLPNNWSSSLVKELATFRPIPGLGVTGPFDPVHSGQLLTHSFVGRRHMDVFGAFFSFTLPNMYSDNWITNVYAPPYRTTKAKMMSVLTDVWIRHAVLNPRYTAKRDQEMCAQQVAIDRQILAAYIEEKMM